MSYTHLQVKSGYSLMQSTITIPKLVKRAEELKFEALALTDEGVLYGTIPFYRACLRHGIKPIIGMTVHVIDDKETIHPCVLLAKNNTGYHTLMKLSTTIQLHEKQAVTFEELKAYSEGLICILPVKGQLASDFRNRSLDEINHYLKSWIAMFANNDFYLGVQASELEAERELHHTVKTFHHAYDVQVTASSDVIYLDEKDAIAYDCLQSMKQGKQWNMELSDPLLKNRHLLSEMELTQSIGSYWPEVLQETEKISRKCTVTFDFEQRLLPSFPVPGEMPAYEYLEKLCFENAVKKYGDLTDVIKDRLIYELKIIQSMKFSDYFLIVADFIGFAKSNNILVGPGRGSSAGSIVAYVLGITEVDPIRYNLLFERFLNPERQTMPDIEIGRAHV